MQTSDEDITYTINTDVQTSSSTGSATASVVFTGTGNTTSGSTAITTAGTSLSSLSLTGDGSTYSKNNYKLTISQSNLSEGDTVTITVTVKSSSPYEKEMTATLIFTYAEATVSYTSALTDNGDYVTLTIEIIDASSAITIAYDTAKVTLDTSSTILQSCTVTSGNITIPTTAFVAGDTIELYFAKVDSGDTITLGTDITVS